MNDQELINFEKKTKDVKVFNDELPKEDYKKELNTCKDFINKTSEKCKNDLNGFKQCTWRDWNRLYWTIAITKLCCSVKHMISGCES